jgi:hypothetical protein
MGPLLLASLLLLLRRTPKPPMLAYTEESVYNFVNGFSWGAKVAIIVPRNKPRVLSGIGPCPKSTGGGIP